MPYSKEFYQRTLSNSKSAEVIVPILISLLNPKSVIDIGCGTGVWLDAFKRQGVNDISGIEGEFFDKKDLIIPDDSFIVADLNKPLDFRRKYDLAISLEVAEHLHEKSADIFIQSLTSLSSVVLFSAAIPHQGGTHHINEQWQDYWINLFDKRGYSVFDVIRKKIWDNPDVKWWYAQNTFLFIAKDKINLYPKLLNEVADLPFNIVHPQKLLEINDPQNMSSIKLLKAIKQLFYKYRK